LTDRPDISGLFRVYVYEIEENNSEKRDCGKRNFESTDKFWCSERSMRSCIGKEKDKIKSSKKESKIGRSASRQSKR